MEELFCFSEHDEESQVWINQTPKVLETWKTLPSEKKKNYKDLDHFARHFFNYSIGFEDENEEVKSYGYYKNPNALFDWMDTDCERFAFFMPEFTNRSAEQGCVVAINEIDTKRLSAMLLNPLYKAKLEDYVVIVADEEGEFSSHVEMSCDTLIQHIERMQNEPELEWKLNLVDFHY